MEALYWKRPTAAEASEIGCTLDDYVEPAVDVLEENWSAIQLFCSFSTQWRLGNAGPAGLDYSVIQYELNRLSLSAESHTDLMDRLRIVERAALEQIHKD